MALFQFCNSVPEFFHSHVVLKLITRLSMKANSLQYCICNKDFLILLRPHAHGNLEKSYLDFLQERPQRASHMRTSPHRYTSLSSFVKQDCPSDFIQNLLHLASLEETVPGLLYVDAPSQTSLRVE